MSKALFKSFKNPLKTQLLTKGQMDVSEVVKAEDWLDALKPGKYRRIVYGYSVLPDGTGFYTDYVMTPHETTSEMIRNFEQPVNEKAEVLDLKAYGLTDEAAAELEAADVTYDAKCEELENGGHRIVLNFTWPNFHASRDAFTLSWIGYKAQDGKIVRDEETRVDEEVVKNLLLENNPGYIEY